MYLMVTDGKAQLAKYSVNFSLTDDLKERLSSYQRESTGCICYTDAEKDALAGILSSLNVTYQVVPITWTQAIIDKSSSKKYNSRSDAIDDFQGTRVDPQEQLQKANADMNLQITNMKSAQADILFAMVTNNLM